MGDDKDEEVDGSAAHGDRHGVDPEAEAASSHEPDDAQQEAGATSTGGPSDPDLARRAERASPSEEAVRLEYDPANEEG